MKILRIVSIICFSIFISGCAIIFGETAEERWDLPEKPKLIEVKFIEFREGYFISAESATNLANNVDELKAYSEKLEALIREMKKYYK